MSNSQARGSKPPALSVQLQNFSAEDPGSWQPLLDRAKAADAAGVDRLVVSDHVVFGENLEAYANPGVGGIEGGRQPTGPDGHWLEPLTLLSVISGITRRARLLTGILIASLRRPVVLAKSAATLDVLSGGRLDLGVGVGWQREEYAAAGLRFEGRGRTLDRTLELCQLFWRERSAHFESEDLAFESIHQMPKPLQPGGVPLWISGTLNPAVLRRIVRFGSGWIPWGPDALEPGRSFQRVREALQAAGRDSEGFEVTAALPAVREKGKLDYARTMERVGPLLEAGITDFRIHATLPADPIETGDFLAEWVAAFRQAAGR